MKSILTLGKILVGVVILLVIGSIFINYYSYIFSRVVSGPVRKVERVGAEMIFAPRSGENPNPQVFSFAVSIEDLKKNEIVVASSEDRQWAAVETGQCATARYYPYPFWDVNKAGTYHNARLLHLAKDCESKKE